MNPILLTITQNDFGCSFNFTLTDAQNQVVDITDGSLFFSCQLQSDPNVNFSNAMSIDSGIAGTCHYIVKSTDFIVSGTYNALIKLQFGSSEVVSFSGITVEVNPIIPS